MKKIEFRYTPKHGSWLNISENELSSMPRQCITGRRFGNVQILGKQTTAWSSHRNANQRTVDWQFTIDDARTKLKTLYPKTKS